MKTLPVRARRAPALAAVLVLLVASPRALAWDPETHASIVRLALAVSPAADARIKDSFESFYDAVRAPDPFDKKCKDHVSAQAPRDPATMAGQALEQLLAGKMLASPAARAHAIGRIVHYVEDAAVPEAMLQDANPLDPFWGETTFTIFRESRPLTRPFADSIRSIGALTRWGADSRSMRAYALRVTVNLVADTLLAIPAEGAVPGDVGPVIFAIDRSDPGPPPAAVQQSLASKVKDLKAKAAARNAPPAERSAEADGPPTDRPGLHLVEWVTRPSGDGVDVRALLYNNDERCAEKISVGGKTVSIDIPGRVAPRSLRTLELHAPATPGLTLRAMSKESPCAPPYAPGSGTPIKERVLLNAATGPLRLDRTLAEPDLSK